MKKDGMERFVASFTLRDSPSDIINLTLWTSRSVRGMEYTLNKYFIFRGKYSSNEI